MNRVLISLACLTVFPGFAHAQYGGGGGRPNNSEAYKIRLEYRFFEAALEGSVAKGFGALPGTDIDVVTDLGFADDRRWEFRGAIRLGPKMKLRGGYTAIDYGAQQLLERRIRFDDTVFQSGEDVASSLKGAFYGGDFEYDFIARPQGFLGLTAGARAPDVDYVISSPNTGKRELGTYRPVVPMLGVIGRFYAGRVSIEGSGASFVAVSGRKAIEAEIGARIHVSDRFALSGGYRYLSFKANAGGDLGDFADFKMSGWTYGIELGL
jgi:hypothetical protein